MDGMKAGGRAMTPLRPPAQRTLLDWHKQKAEMLKC
jgi:hypothetical protein